MACFQSNFEKEIIRLVGGLFLGFFVGGILFAPLAILFELDFALHLLPVLPAPVVDALAAPARQFDKMILGHKFIDIFDDFLDRPTITKTS